MMSASWTPPSTGIEAVCFMWRHGVIEILSLPPMLVWIIRRGVPMAPSSISARASRLIGSRRKFSATERTLPRLRAASMIRLQPRMVTASGFSHRTCRPASRQAVATVWCEPLSAVTSAAWRSGISRTIWAMSVKTRGRARRAARSASSASKLAFSGLGRRRRPAPGCTATSCRAPPCRAGAGGPCRRSRRRRT